MVLIEAQIQPLLVLVSHGFQLPAGSLAVFDKPLMFNAVHVIWCWGFRWYLTSFSYIFSRGRVEGDTLTALNNQYIF